ncbi:MAG: aldo/keto reductase [Candidatus Poribacteria bacterium]
MKMKSKPLIASIGKPVSQLALGTAFYDVKSTEKCFDIIDEYIKLGGTIIDSARGYGTSEDVLGLWLDSHSAREQIVIITKCGLTNDGILPSDGYPELVHRELTTSLQTLRTDYIDIYMLHRDNKQMTVTDILEPLNDEIANGRIKALGASNWEYHRISEANEYASKHDMKGFAVVSNNISLAVQSAPFYPGLISTDKAGERWHEETGIPLIPWSSQARGFFTGRYTPEMRYDSSDGFTKRMIEVYCTDENFERLSRARELGEKKGYTAVEVALNWLLHKPFPIVPIVGPHTKEEMASCVNAISLTLTEDEVKWLNGDQA